MDPVREEMDDEGRGLVDETNKVEVIDRVLFHLTDQDYNTFDHQESFANAHQSKVLIRHCFPRRSENALTPGKNPFNMIRPGRLGLSGYPA